MTYIWEQIDWPHFRWSGEELLPLLAQIRHGQGRLLGAMENLGLGLQHESLLESRVLEARETSAIENVVVPDDQVRSSVARRLGLPQGGLPEPDRRVDNLVAMVLDATQNPWQVLDAARLKAWHGLLFPEGRSGFTSVDVGQWRQDIHGPMQVVSGSMGKEKVHFEAPPAHRIGEEIEQFLGWFNRQDTTLDPLLKSAIAHLWFLTIHPFDDGNGRIARAIADLALARTDGANERYYSMAAQIRSCRRDYYHILEATQRGDLDIGQWLRWYLEQLGAAIATSQTNLKRSVELQKFWLKVGSCQINLRQRQVLELLSKGMDGPLTSSRWARICNCSQDSANRDIAGLVVQGFLSQSSAGGRSTSYSLLL